MPTSSRNKIELVIFDWDGTTLRIRPEFMPLELSFPQPLPPYDSNQKMIFNEAVQIHGGYGFTKDYPVEKFLRESKLCTIGEGTSEIQKIVIKSLKFLNGQK